MKKAFVLIAALLLLCGPSGLRAQEKWTLRQCIDYAVENNIDIKITRIGVEESEIDLRDMRNYRLPNLNAGLSQNFSFGRAPSPEDNTYRDSQTSSTGLSVSSSVPIYEGGYARNRIKAGELDLKAATAYLESAREDLELQVTTYYLDVLYYKELLKVYEQELALSQKQLERVEALVNAQMSARTELLQTQAQVAANAVTVTQARGRVESALLTLTQALNLETMAGFDIAEPDTDTALLTDYAVASPDEIFARAVEVKPHIREQEYRLQSSIAGVRVARSALFPSVSFGLSYSNGYSYIFGNNSVNDGFAKQIRTRGNEAVGISISIPIYNKGYTRSNINRAQLSVISRELRLENTKLNIYKEIQQACLDARNAVEQHRAAEAAALSSSEAYKLTEESFNVGVSTALELEEARSKLVTSLSEQVRSKYEYLFRSKILDFYRGIPIKL